MYKTIKIHARAAAVYAVDAAQSAASKLVFGCRHDFDCSHTCAESAKELALEEACATGNTELNNVSDVKEQDDASKT